MQLRLITCRRRCSAISRQRRLALRFRRVREPVVASSTAKPPSHPQESGKFIYHLIVFFTIMDFVQTLDSVLGSRSLVAMLRALVALPRGFSVSARDLARRASISHPSALSALETLHEQGIVDVRREPKRNAYSLNREHVLSQKLVGLFEQEDELQAQLQTFLAGELRKRFPRLRLALLFGSAAEGLASASSDIDLFLLVQKNQNTEEAVLELGETVRRVFGNHMSVIVEDIPKTEFLKKARRNHLWSKILQTGTPLVGHP